MDLFEFSKNENAQLYYAQRQFYVTSQGGWYRHYGNSFSDLVPFILSPDKMNFAFFSGNTKMAGIDVGDGSLHMREANETFYEFLDKVFG